MLCQTSKTAIKAVIYLSLKSKQGCKAGIREVAEQIGANEHTVGKILQMLARKQCINSLKGPTGGFYLNEAQQQQPISEIVETFEGKGLFRECGLGLNKCSAAHPCPIHDEYKVARDLVEKLFREKQVQDLCAPVHEGLAYLIG